MGDGSDRIFVVSINHIFDGEVECSDIRGIFNSLGALKGALASQGIDYSTLVWHDNFAYVTRDAHSEVEVGAYMPNFLDDLEM